MSITKSLLLILFSTVLITACDSSLDTSDDTEGVAAKENLVEATGNPCLEPWAIDRMKEHIKERAEEVITNKYGAGVIDTSLLYDSEISFDYISQPTTLENGDLSCSAEVNVSYLGNANSADDLAVMYSKLVNSNIGYNSNPFANVYSGYDIKRELASMGISEFNINEFNDISGNTFSTKMDYQLKKTYSETGEEQQSYEAGIGKPAAMLATIALLDKFIQRNKNSDNASGVDSMEDQAVKADSYYEDEYVEDYEDYEDDSAITVDQTQKASNVEEPRVEKPDNENQKVDDRKQTKAVTSADADEGEIDTDIDEDKYDTSYVYGYEAENVD